MIGCKFMMTSYKCTNQWHNSTLGTSNQIIFDVKQLLQEVEIALVWLWLKIGLLLLLLCCCCCYCCCCCLQLFRLCGNVLHDTLGHTCSHQSSVVLPLLPTSPVLQIIFMNNHWNIFHLSPCSRRCLWWGCSDPSCSRTHSPPHCPALHHSRGLRSCKQTLVAADHPEQHLDLQPLDQDEEQGVQLVWDRGHGLGDWGDPPPACLLPPVTCRACRCQRWVCSTTLTPQPEQMFH